MVVTGSIQHIMLLKDFQLPTASIIKKKKKRRWADWDPEGKEIALRWNFIMWEAGGWTQVIIQMKIANNLNNSRKYSVVLPQTLKALRSQTQS